MGRPSEEIPPVATDYDAAHDVLSVIKARVHGLDKHVTKTSTDHRVVLSPRAVAVLERQLRLCKRWVRAGRIDHEHLFFTATGEPIRHLGYPYARRRRTLRKHLCVWPIGSRELFDPVFAFFRGEHSETSVRTSRGTHSRRATGFQSLRQCFESLAPTLLV
jgi:hypothetical protein